MKLGDKVKSLLTGETGRIVKLPRYGEMTVQMSDGRMAHAPPGWWMPIEPTPTITLYGGADMEMEKRCKNCNHFLGEKGFDLCCALGQCPLGEDGSCEHWELRPKEVTPCWHWYAEQYGTPIDGYDWEEGWQCSECGALVPESYSFYNPPDFKYCPYCGVKMHEGGNIRENI